VLEENPVSSVELEHAVDVAEDRLDRSFARIRLEAEADEFSQDVFDRVDVQAGLECRVLETVESDVRSEVPPVTLGGRVAREGGGSGC
tara:strand:- start:820 stop:1083 length:264 start_codon:yes stop_codon:yes gene_type:complete